MENIKLSGNELIGNTPLLELRKFENKYKISNNRIEDAARRTARTESWSSAAEVLDECSSRT